MITRSSALRGLAAGAAALALPSLARAQTLKPLNAGYVPSTLFAPLFVATERGYLRDAGFAPNLTPIVAGQDSMALVAQGRLDLVAAGVSGAFFNAVDRGLDVKFVAATGYQPRKGHPTALMIRQDLWDAGQHDAGSLRGKKVGWIGGAGSTSEYYVARILRRYGMTLKDIEGVNIASPDQEVALERKAIDAVFTSSPFTDLFADRKLSQIIGSPGVGIAATGIFFGPTLLHDPDDARAVIGALRKAAADIVGAGYYAPQNIEAYAKYTKQSIDLIKRADRYDFKADLRIDQGTLQDMQTVFVEQGLLAYKTPLNEVRLVARF